MISLSVISARWPSPDAYDPATEEPFQRNRRVRSSRRPQAGAKGSRLNYAAAIPCIRYQFELMINLSKIIEELWIVLPLRGGLFQQLCRLRVVPAPIVENAKRFGDFRIVWIGLAGLRASS